MTADPLASWWVHTVSVERHSGNGPEGDTYTAPATEPCFVSDKRRLVLAASGEQVVSETTVLFPKTTADIPVDSRITLPAPFGSRETRALSVSRHHGGGQPTPDHLEVAVQ